MSVLSESAPIVTIDPNTELRVDEIIERLIRELPHSEQFGGPDFSKSTEAVVVNIIVECDNLFLGLMRSDANDSHRGVWNNIAGYMKSADNGRGMIMRTVKDELKEEADIDITAADSVQVGVIIEVQLPSRMLYVVPGLVRFETRPEVNIDYEHSERRWFNRTDFLQEPRVPVVDDVFATMLG